MPDFLFPNEIDFPSFDPGSVWLVGAGPGDPKLLTLFGYYALQKADVIVHDALVSSEILKLAPPGIELIQMGKRGGTKSPQQKDINETLIKLAEVNQRILRLKGGDPFVFGRGAEEAMALIKQDIPVKIVPGISAGISGTAYGGVPVTEGSRNQVVSFVTGHDNKGNVPGVNWQALSDSSPVIVFYMPMNHLENIRNQLITAGRDPDDPVFFISKATTPDQITLDSTLKNCLDDCEKNAIKAPSLMIVGPTLDLRATLKACF